LLPRWLAIRRWCQQSRSHRWVSSSLVAGVEGDICCVNRSHQSPHWCPFCSAVHNRCQRGSQGHGIDVFWHSLARPNMASRRARGSCIKTRLQGTRVFLPDKYLATENDGGCTHKWKAWQGSLGPSSLSGCAPCLCNHTHMVWFLHRVSGAPRCAALTRALHMQLDCQGRAET